MAAQFKRVRDFADRVIRDSLLHPENLQGLLQKAIPDEADHFLCEQARLLNREFPLEDWRRREADLPFEIPYRLDDATVPALVVVLIEHQSATDTMMPLRLLFFAANYWDRQWKDWESSPPPKETLKLNPVVPIVFYTGETPWGSNRTIVDLLGEPECLHPLAPLWEPIFWNLASESPENLLASSNAWTQMLAVLRADQEETNTFETVYTQVVQQIQKLSSTEKVRCYDLLRVVLTWALWQRPKPEHDRFIEVVKDLQTDSDQKKEIRDMTNKLGPTIEDIALAEAEVTVSRKSLLMLINDRFGSVPPELKKRIDGTDDPESLQEALLKVYKVEKLEDLPL